MEQQETLWQDALVTEVLQHAKMCETRSKAFHGRQDVLGAIKDYLRHIHSQPMVIYGDSGSGKTSIMAMVAQQAASWSCASQPVIITRLLGMMTFKCSMEQGLPIISVNKAPVRG